MSRDADSDQPKIQHKIQHNIENGILHVTVAGSIRIPELAAYARAHIDDWSNCRGVVWDMRDLEFFGFSLESLLGMPDEFAEVRVARAGGRTALVVRKRDDLLGEMVVNLATAPDWQIERQVFLSIEDALAWLNQEV